MTRRPRIKRSEIEAIGYLEWQIDHDLQNPTTRNQVWVARATKTLEELKQKLKRGTRGPPQRDLCDDPDSKHFSEIRRLMEEQGLSPYAATASLENDGKISGEKAASESRIQRVYRKFLRQR